MFGKRHFLERTDGRYRWEFVSYVSCIQYWSCGEIRDAVLIDVDTYRVNSALFDQNPSLWNCMILHSSRLFNSSKLNKWLYQLFVITMSTSLITLDFHVHRECVFTDKVFFDTVFRGKSVHPVILYVQRMFAEIVQLCVRRFLENFQT